MSQNPPNPPYPPQPPTGGPSDHPPPGPAPPAPPPRSGGRKTGLIVLVAVVVVAAAAGGAYFLLADDDDERTPEGTVRTLFTAIRTGDCDTLVDLYTEDSWRYLASFDEDTPDDIDRDDALQLCRESFEEDDEEFTDELDEVDLTSLEGDRAVVEVTTTSEGEQTTESVVLAREDGEWRFDLPATDELPNDDTGTSEP